MSSRTLMISAKCNELNENENGKHRISLVTEHTVQPCSEIPCCVSYNENFDRNLPKPLTPVNQYVIEKVAIRNECLSYVELTPLESAVSYHQSSDLNHHEPVIPTYYVSEEVPAHNHGLSLAEPIPSTTSPTRFSDEHIHADENLSFHESDDSLKDEDYIPSPTSDEEGGDTRGRNSLRVDANKIVKVADTNLKENIGVHVDANNQTAQTDGIPLAGAPGKPKRGRQPKPEEERTRKRLRNDKSWKENVRRKLKEEGKKYYVSKEGTLKKAKELKEPCNCRMKCYTMFEEEQRKKIFEDFYKLPKHGQDQFISESVKDTQKQRERVRQSTTNSRRNFTRKHFLTNKEGRSTEVCQVMYLHTFGLFLKKVRVFIEKKRSSESNIYPADGRGRNGKHCRIGEDQKNTIRRHIKSFPAYSSHCSRERTSKKYLSFDVSIAVIYRLYREYCRKANVKAEKESQYRKIFNEELNLAFHALDNDTCAKCDRLHLSLQTFENTNLAKEEEEATAKIMNGKETHLDLTESACKQKSSDKECCKKDRSLAVASFDSEKCLPTPYLRNGVLFYKRQLWTYNLTVYETTAMGSYGKCFLWNETIAARGGQEIASRIRQYISTLSEEISILRLYSDSCTGQNRNIFMCTMFCFMMHEIKRAGGHLKEIHHKFMEPGHSHMEADTIHGLIETAKKRTTVDIEVPHDWCNFIKSVRRKPPLQVFEMKQTDFLNFGSLLRGKLVHRKKNEENENIPWLQIKWFKFTQEDDFQFFYETSLNDTESFKKVDLRRGSKRKRLPDIDMGQLEPLNRESLSLADLKDSNLMELLLYISEYNKPFYENLKGSVELDAEDIPDNRHSAEHDMFS